MRISTPYLFDNFAQSIDRASQHLVETQRAVTTGKRINTLSDDPSGNARALSMQSLKSRLAQYTSNLQSAKGALSFAESALSDVSDLATQAYTLALNGANATNDQSTMQAMAGQILSIQQRLVQLANTQGPSGAFVFAGQDNTSPPFAANNGALTFTGDTNMIQVQVGPSDVMASTVDASAFLTDLYAKLETLKTNLGNGDIAALSDTSIQDMQNAVSTASTLEATVGQKLQMVADLNNQNSRRIADLTTQLSDIQDVDAAAAILEYQEAQTAYQAALSATTSGAQLSLMDFLRNNA
jgi:flagellar hook-associated protein 3 FlgL